MKNIAIIAVVLVLLVASTSLAAVTNPPLVWVPPTENCDMSPVTVTGYIIKWGDVSGGPYPNEVVISDPLATSTTVDVGNVADQTLYFTVVTVNNHGNRSDDPSGCSVEQEVSRYFPLVIPKAPLIQ